MDIEILRAFFAWCSLLNLAVLVVWFLLLTFARDGIHRFHARWFRLSEERFDFAHYLLLGAYEIFFFLFCLMPYLALRIIGVLHY